MEKTLQSELIALWRSSIEQCQRTLDFLDATGLRIAVCSIDITDAERSAAKDRIEHLEKLIDALRAEHPGAR
ncbi:hypothetical protein [Brevundimonas variabilis]|uniref:Uncharacterized protein n=1 Tax=Brevundimonas variabilis TaxID=74312 RepID=A0A7W9CGE6_9CAUL|nr:hypothetical protein [Brevundimonas variabilis]MBB5745177.1 hypothetical protein [Brevundimonas variabilis]